MKPAFTSETTSTDLIFWTKKLHIPLNFIGFKNKLKQANIKVGAYIVNLADSYDGSGGSHWVSFYLSPSYHAFYFDSFGAASLDEAMSIMKNWTKSIPYIYINPYDIQNIMGGFCGEYVIDFLASIMRNPTRDGFITFLKQYQLFRVQKNTDTYI